MKRPILLQTIAFFLAPAFIYALVATRGTLNIFHPDYGWPFYNQYALAILHGRLTVPAEAIGPEGLYIGGRVYAYYGILPALLRLPFTLFLDLRHTPLSTLINWALTTGSAAALQVAALDVYRWRSARDGAPAPRLPLVLASACIWFFSGAALIIQSASFYYEPFACSLLASSLFILISVRIMLFGGGLPTLGQLAAMGALAGACLLARQTTAISLYLGTLAWLAVSGLQVLRGGPDSLGALIRWTIAKAAIPLGLMFIAGVAYLALNYVRFGSIGASFPIDRYGYMLIAPEDERLLVMRNEGLFEPLRIIPNVIFALIGGDELRQKLITAMGGGPVEAFAPIVRLAFAWTPSFLACLITLRWLAHDRLKSALARFTLMVTACLSVGALLQLSYATASYRYYADVWPPLAFLIVMSAGVRGAPLSAPLSKAFTGVAATASAVAIAYMAYMTLGGSMAIGRWMTDPLPPVLAAEATGPGARDPGLPGGMPSTPPTPVVAP